VSPRKKKTHPSKPRATFLYQSSRERMDAIEAAAEKHHLKPNSMLDRMVDDWLQNPVKRKSGRKPTVEEVVEEEKKQGNPWWNQ